ncbi:MAG TPA: RMD1 family protein [Sulfuricurvum sp.]|nr:RMD1 family protein [Sulfuricurvum sp.]
MNLLSLDLSKPINRSALEYALDITLEKSIENGLYGRNDSLHILLAPFDVITFIADEKATILQSLSKLGLTLQNDEEGFVYQDYPIEINPAQEEPFIITNEAIFLKNPTTLNLKIIALAISQSVGLERYEKKLNSLFSQNRKIVESIHTFSIARRSSLMKFIQSLALIRHNMVGDLLLLDKPNILWDDGEAEMLYNQVAFILELNDRHEIALSKLSQIKEDVMLVMDLLNHKQSEFLEWIIIILIGVEIVMGLIDWLR